MRHSIASAFLVLLSASCAKVPAAAPTTAHAAPAKSSVKEAKLAASDAETPRRNRNVGDFWVHRISGSFSARPMLLIERVAAESEGIVQIEYLVEDAEGSTKLLVSRDAESDEIRDVTRVFEDHSTPGTVADYEALMARTALVPDSNEGFMDRTLGTCLVGPSELDCETKSYHVMIGDKSATLDITHSEKFPERDIGGEISTDDGQVIYRSELIEAGHEGQDDSSFASAE